jgi:plastocyanin
MRRLPIIASLAVAALAVTGCGGSSGTPVSSAPVSTPADAAPAASSGKLDPNFDFGQTVTITRTGFQPAWLVSLIGQPVTWTNDSGAAQSVVFDHLPVRSKVIPPGGTYVYTPQSMASITYHSGVHPDLRGKLQATPGASSGQ